MRIAHWLRVGAPFLLGCFAGLCLAVGMIAAVRSGVAAFDQDWEFFAVLITLAACFVAGGSIVITNGMEFHT